MALPITIEAAKAQLRITDELTDAEVTDLIADAVGWVEAYTGHMLSVKTVEVTFDSWDEVELNHWPLDPATLAVSVIRQGAEDRLIDGVQLDTRRRPARLVTPQSGGWPTLTDEDQVQLSFNTGYASATDIPRNLIRAALVLIAGFEADKEGGKMFAESEATARNLCRKWKRWTV